MVVHKTGGGLRATITTAEVAGAIAYFLLLAVVVLRGLPTSPSTGQDRAARRSRRCSPGCSPFALVRLLRPLAIVPMPLLLLAVPGRGGRRPGAAGRVPGRRRSWPSATSSRTWGVWLLAILFSTPIWISVALVVLNFSVGTTQFVLTFALAAPIIWPFSALFVRALYGDLTGRLVVAPQDRSR